jgi:AcrR family transcriptional regulator
VAESPVSAARQELLERAVAWFAEHGVGDTSMRTLAQALGTSHRMLHYHFGSREALLSAVMERVERGERDMLAGLLRTAGDPFDAGMAFWNRVADTAQSFAPLYFELSSHAMRRRPNAEAWRDWLASGWVEVLTRLYRDAGAAPAAAEDLARVSLAQARGLLFALALSGDREAADAAMRRFADLVRASLAADPSH